jgi:heterodisulfide reductase subunit A-like polyferredoxin
MPERSEETNTMTITVKHQMLIVGGGTAGITVAVRMLCQHDW